MPQSGVQRPVVVLTCNWQAGNDGMYLSTDDVRTLFHELGHSLHCTAKPRPRGRQSWRG